MKYRVGIIVLIVICLGLGVGLISLKKSADTQQAKDGVTITTFSNDLAATTSKLEEQKQVSTMLEKDLDTQKKSYVELTNKFTDVTVTLAQTEKKLAASEGSRELLEKELKRLMGEKAELERQFNDLTVLRAQVAKLKEELSIARRMEWIRQGLFASADQKGAQKLMQGVAPVASKPPAKPGYDLNVEVSADGSVRVVPPATNSPANPAAPK